MDGLVILDHPGAPKNIATPMVETMVEMGVINIGRMRLVLETWNLVETHWNTLQFTAHEQELWLADDFKEFLYSWLCTLVLETYHDPNRLDSFKCLILCSAFQIGWIHQPEPKWIHGDNLRISRVSMICQSLHRKNQRLDAAGENSWKLPERGLHPLRCNMICKQKLLMVSNHFKSCFFVNACLLHGVMSNIVQLTIFLQTKNNKAPQQDIQLMNRLSWTCIGPCCHCQSFRHVWRCHG